MIKVNNKILDLRLCEMTIYYRIQDTRKTDRLLLSDKWADLDAPDSHKANYNGQIIHQ